MLFCGITDVSPSREPHQSNLIKLIPPPSYSFLTQLSLIVSVFFLFTSFFNHLRFSPIATQHRATTQPSGERKLVRTTIKGDFAPAATAVQLEPFIVRKLADPFATSQAADQ